MQRDPMEGRITPPPKGGGFERRVHSAPPATIDLTAHERKVEAAARPVSPTGRNIAFDEPAESIDLDIPDFLK